MNNQADNKETNRNSKTFLRLRTVTLALLVLAGIGMDAYYLFAAAGETAVKQGDSSPATVANSDAAVNNNNTLESLIRDSIAMGDDATALKYQEQLLTKYKETGNREGEIKTLESLVQTTAMMGLMGGNTPDLKYQEQLLSIYRESGDREGEVKMLNSMIGRAFGGYDFVTALKYQEQLLTIYKESGNREGESNALSKILERLSILSAMYEWDDYDTNLKYLKRLLSIDRESGNAAWDRLLHDIWKTSYGNETKAIKHLKTHLVVAQEIGDLDRESEVLTKIGGFYHTMGHYSNNSNRLDDFASSVKYLEQSLAIIQKMDDRKKEAYTNWDIGMTSKDLGDLTKAEGDLTKAAAIINLTTHYFISRIYVIKRHDQ